MAVAGGTKYSAPPHRGQKIIVNQSKPILVIVSIKPITRQSFRQNYFSRGIEWAVFTKTASEKLKTCSVLRCDAALEKG